MFTLTPTKIKIDNEFKRLIPPLTEEEFNQLEQNILSEGIREKIVTWEGIIIDGHNRYEIALKHGLEFEIEEKIFESREDAKIWMYDNAFGQRNLSDFAKYENRKGKAEELRRKGREKLSEAGKIGREIQLGGLSIVDKGPAHDTRKTIASELNFSTGKVAMADIVDKKAPEEIKEKLRTGDISINQAYKEIKQAEKKEEIKQKHEELKQKEILPPTGKYDVVVIDPPWPIEKIQRDVSPNQIAMDYPTMSIDEISALKIPAEKDCHVFLWTIHKFLPDALKILEKWELKYVCTFTWHKPGGFQPWGLPQYNSEFCLYARKGTPFFTDTKSFNTCFEAPRGKHSEKPDFFYDMIRRVTTGKRIDIFNRRKLEGFETWGNEAI